MTKKILPLLTVIVFFGCNILRKSNNTSTHQTNGQHGDTSLTVKTPADEYRPASTRTIDILHTKLEINFDWEKQHLNGKATITLKPYFYPINEIILEAKGFDIKEIFSFSNPKKILPFTYDKSKLIISLNKEYTRNDTLIIFIAYTAKPNERETTVGNAITSDKGLYFINPLGKEKDKPTQLWSQGEPESNSCWFPTIDKPNERMTQEIYITIDSTHKKFVTLSNGLLISSKKNSDGSRTDYWKQSLPAAPYLTMIAVGDFTIVKDKWKNIDVNYYVEHEYEPYANLIFGKTPEMIEFFSTKLGTQYPWEKFSQIVVRDYVSGAMENTSAVLHGDFLNMNDREYLDNNFEDVISHELFHQWFGDYVTCKTWSNITLNEGFATYGEYLWQEFKYGRDLADQHARKSMIGFLSIALKYPKHLIRYNYNSIDDVFDANSYNKGGAVIHMLRKYIGDDAFFSALKIYLEKNKFNSVEADDLRSVFEQVTGEDLHWFFDQWYYGIGQPRLLIQHNYIDSLKKYTIRIEQKQDLSQMPLFKLPIDVDIYSDGKKERKRIWVTKEKEDFSFSVFKKPDFVNVDAEKSLLCHKEEKLSISERSFQYKNCPLYLDRLEAFKECISFPSIPEAAEIMLSALHDKNFELRERAIQSSEKIPAEHKQRLEEELIDLAKNDQKSSVRSYAIQTLSSLGTTNNLESIFEQLTKDKSYNVLQHSLAALAKKNPEHAIILSKKFEDEKNIEVLLEIAEIYSANGTDINQPFFTKVAAKVKGWEEAIFINSYVNFLKRCSDDTINSGIKIFETIAFDEANKQMRYLGSKGIKDISQMYLDRENKISEELKKLKSQPNNLNKMQSLETQLTQAKRQREKLSDIYNSMTTTN